MDVQGAAILFSKRFLGKQFTILFFASVCSMGESNQHITFVELNLFHLEAHIRERADRRARSASTVWMIASIFIQYGWRFVPAIHII